MNLIRLNVYMLEQNLLDLVSHGDIPHSDYVEMSAYIDNIKAYSGIVDNYPRNVKYNKQYRVKNIPEELGLQFHWMIGKIVTVIGERQESNHKFPIEYDKSDIPNDGFSLLGKSIRGDLLEEIEN